MSANDLQQTRDVQEKRIAEPSRHVAEAKITRRKTKAERRKFKRLVEELRNPWTVETILTLFGSLA